MCFSLEFSVVILKQTTRIKVVGIWFKCFMILVYIYFNSQ